MPVVEARYAEALFSVVPSAETAGQTEAALSDFSALLSEHEELRGFMLNPVISKEIKKDTARKVLSRTSMDAAPAMANFISLLIDRERLELLPAVCREYKRLKDAWQNNLDIKVYSAEALEESQLSKIIEKYKNQYGALTANVQNYTDPSLLGGIRIKIGDTYIDDTLSGRLKGLMSAIET